MLKAKAYEDCNDEEKAGWVVGQDEFINGSLPGDEMSEFLEALREEYKERRADFLNGAEWGARGEDDAYASE